MPADTSPVGRALAYARDHAASAVRELAEFVRIPSVSGEPAHTADVTRCAEWLRTALRRAGLRSARLLKTGGAPLVTAEHRGAPRAPTLLVYGHYDVQPVGCISEWRTPPFQPLVANGVMIGRGASDDKGQLLAHVKAIEAWLGANHRLPLNVVCVFEGEEEIGSPSLRRFLADSAGALGTDAAIISDTRMRAPDRPAITYALRGKIRLEIDVSRAGHGVHAGQFGGAVANPAHALARIVASLHDPSGRVVIAGFEDGVRGVSLRERSYMARTGPSNAEVHAAAGLATANDAGDDITDSLYERTTIHPSLTVTNVRVGGGAAHEASAIPNRAVASLDVRIVPDQLPQRIVRSIEEHVRSIETPGCEVAVRLQSASRPLLLEPHHPALRAAMRAATRTFGSRAVLLRSGGTIPVASTLASIGITPVLLGFALSTDAMHAPNERFALARYAQATECSIRFLAEAARELRGATRGRPRQTAGATGTLL